MGRKYDVGVIDCMSKKGCGIATKRQTWNPLSLIGYTQIGTYKGDMSGFKSGDKIKLTVLLPLRFLVHLLPVGCFFRMKKHFAKVVCQSCQMIGVKFLNEMIILCCLLEAGDKILRIPGLCYIVRNLCTSD